MKVFATHKVLASAQQGVTLIEMVMAIVLLSIALLSTVSVMNASVSRSADPLIQHKAVLLSQAYFDEILTKRFAETTPIGGIPAVTGAAACTIGSDAGESRTGYDDIDDYDGINEMPPQTQVGVALGDYADFRVEVDVACSGLTVGLSNNHDAKLVTVTITPPQVGALVFTAHRGNY